jgi:hypothetical protein
MILSYAIEPETIIFISVNPSNQSASIVLTAQNIGNNDLCVNDNLPENLKCRELIFLTNLLIHNVGGD